MSDDATAAIHAEIAAKLRRAGSLTIGADASTAPKNKRPKISSSNGGSSTSSATTSFSNGAIGGASGSIGATGKARKLLHWTEAQWRAFEASPLFAKVLPSAKILPIRAPLSSLYEIHYADENATYAPSALMEKLLAASRSGPVINVGLVIDAFGSDCFLHNIKEWEDWDVSFTKLRVLMPIEGEQLDADHAARKAAAEDAMVMQFCEQVEKHKKSDAKDMEIAVFAVDFNFVGFLVVSYLVEYCEMGLDAALKEFAAALSPGISSRYYLERLYRKYFATLPSSSSTVKCPAAPKWETTQPTEDAGVKIGSAILTEQDHQSKFVRKNKSRAGVVPATTPTGSVPSLSSTPTGASHASSSAPTYKPPLYIPPVREDVNARATKRRKVRSWTDDVEPLEYGETLDASSEEHAKVLSALEKLTSYDGFPGCEAIPLTATHVASEAYKKRGCLTNAYFVTWRARGRRCMLFIAEGGTYIVSRDMTFTKVNMKFPRRRALNESQINTLIDGLIVEDEDNGKKLARYLAFDIAFLEGSPIWQKKLEKRLQCLQNEIILPRKNDTTFDYATEPFRVRMKDHFKLSKTEYMLTKFVKDVTHEVDGVIFTPLEPPYNLGGFEADDPIFKFVASESGGGIPGLDGSITQRRLLQFIQGIPPK